MTTIVPIRQIALPVFLTTLFCNIGWLLLTSAKSATAAPEAKAAAATDPLSSSKDKKPLAPSPRGAFQSGLEQISHQGVVAVNGQPFTGTGLFRFAIVDPDAGVNRWTNDGSMIGFGSTPNSAVSLPVANGVYNVRLGDTSIANMTSSIPISLFADDNLRLRIWFDDQANGVQLLTPDQPLTLTAYSGFANSVPSPLSPPLGSIIAWHKNIGTTPLSIPDGWLECNGQALPMDSPLRMSGAQNTPDLNNIPQAGYSKGVFLRGSTHSGDLQFQDIQSHNHLPAVGNFIEYIPSGGTQGLPGGTGPAQFPATGSTSNTGGAETRPVNVSVVWIIRVK